MSQLLVGVIAKTLHDKDIIVFKIMYGKVHTFENDGFI